MDITPAYLFLGGDSVTRCVNFAQKGLKVFMVAGSSGGELSIWDVEARRLRCCKKTAHADVVLAVGVMSRVEDQYEEEGGEDNRFLSLVSHGRDGLVLWWDVSVKGVWTIRHAVSCLKMNFCKGSFCNLPSIHSPPPPNPLSQHSPSSIHPHSPTPPPIHLIITPCHLDDSSACLSLHVLRSTSIKLLHTLTMPVSIKSALLLDTAMHQHTAMHHHSIVVVTGHDGGAVVVQMLHVVDKGGGDEHNDCEEEKQKKGGEDNEDDLEVKRVSVMIDSQMHRSQAVMAVHYWEGEGGGKGVRSRRGVSGCSEGSVVLWGVVEGGGDGSSVVEGDGVGNCEGGKGEKWRIREKRRVDLGQGVSVVRFRQDGKVLAVADFEGTVHVMTGSGLRYLACIRYHLEPILEMSFNPHDQHLAVCCTDSISFYTLYS